MKAASSSSGKCQLTGDAMAVHAGVISGGVLQRFTAFGLAAAVGLAGCTASELPRLSRTQADLISARQADQEKSVTPSGAMRSFTFSRGPRPNTTPTPPGARPRRRSWTS